jgi:16S rRNA (cytidine1402-2'-O)-methyltransferase
MPGTLFVVATPIGNLEDVTLRALRVLREVNLIAAEDTRRTSHLLARHSIATPTTSLHEHNEASKSAALVARLVRGESIAVVSDAGTPTVSDPGGRFIHAAIDAGIRVEPIPGPSAVLALLAVAGLPTDSFFFAGFPPTRSKDRKSWLDRLRVVAGTVVFFEAPHRIRRTLTDLSEAFGNCEVVVGRELTKVHEELVKEPILTALNRLAEPRGEFTIAINIGRTPDISPSRSAEAQFGDDKYGQMTENVEPSKRRTLAGLAKRYGLGTNEIYNLIEDVKNLSNDQT